MPPLDPLACAAVLLLAFSIAGFLHTAWLSSRWSHALALPLDCGLTFRGKRVFGVNKTVRGLAGMVACGAVTLPIAALALRRAIPEPSGVWPLTAAGYAALGAWSGFGFMVGELPNSFLKRQLDIAPGAACERFRHWQLAADRLDSPIGMLAAASLAVHVPWATCALVIAIGPVLHNGFSLLMFRAGLKPRSG